MLFANSLAFLALLSAPALSASAKHVSAPRASGTDSPVPVPISLVAPRNASRLAHSLVSFSIEGDRWADWVGTSTPNTYFINLLRNLGELTGHMPDIRVGANSEDRTFFDKSVKVATATYPPPSSATPYPEASTIRVSDGYYALSKWLPAGTKVIWGVNQLSSNVTNAVAMAKSIVKAFSADGPAHSAGVSLAGLQIGNEADLYVGHGFRPKSWNISAYVGEWERFAREIIKATKIKSNTNPRFWIGAFCTSLTCNSAGFSAQGLYAQGILDGPYGDYIDTFSQHHYQSSMCQDAHGPAAQIPTFMDKSTIRLNISEFDAGIRATHAHGLKYILGETNSISCHGAPGVSNTAAAAAWMIEYSFQAAVHGIKKSYFHNGIGFKYNLIQPVHLDRSPLDNSPASLAPHIHPQYYAAIVINTFIGKSDASIAEVPVGGSNSTVRQYVSGYAAYENGALKRAVFLNLRPYLKGSTTPRGSFDIQIVVPRSGRHKPNTLRVRRLKIDHADDTEGLTFAGRTYETKDGRPSGEDTYTDVPYGSPVKISDTEAVLVTFRN